MNIVLPKYSTNYNLIPLSKEKEANDLGVSFQINPEKADDSYVVFWGNKNYHVNYGKKYGVMETGFFNGAAFIDTVGNYQFMSLNSHEGYKAVDTFDIAGRKTAKEIIDSLPKHMQSKYNPIGPGEVLDWKGPVLILQNPSDRSILSITSRKNYLKFVNDACKYYGDKLFVKFHPWNSGEKYKELEEIVKPHGCKYGKAKLDIINNAEFCFSFNSTFAVDSLLRGVPYSQYAMGTFYNAYGVVWTKGRFPVKVEPKEDGQKLCNFLIHRFCFNKAMHKVKFVEMLNHYSRSEKMFPMNDEFSYANNLPV